MKLKFVVVVLVLALSLSLVYLSSVTKESVDDHRFAISNDISKADKSAFSKLKGNFGKAAAEQIISKNIKQDHKHNKDCTCSLNRINTDKYLNAGIVGSEKIQMDDIPDSNLREDLVLLDSVIADMAFSKLSNLGHEIVLQDLSHIRVDRRGGIFYACPLPEDYQEVSKIDPTIIDLSLSRHLHLLFTILNQMRHYIFIWTLTERRSQGQVGTVVQRPGIVEHGTKMEIMIHSQQVSRLRLKKCGKRLLKTLRRSM